MSGTHPCYRQITGTMGMDSTPKGKCSVSIQRKSTPVATVSFAIKLDASIKDAPQAG